MASILLLSSCHTNTLVPSTNIITKEVHNPATFTQLNIEGNINVIYTMGTPSIRIVASDNIIPLIKIDVADNTATIQMDRHLFLSFRDVDEPKVYISSPSLVSVNLNGSGDLALDTDIVTENFNMRIAGSGDITSKDITCSNELNCDVSGSGDIKIMGKVYASNVSTIVKGSGDLKIGSLTSPSIKTGIAGSGDMEIAEVKSNKFETYINGSGESKFFKIESDSVIATINGSGDMALAGKANVASYTIMASGEIKAHKLYSNDTKSVIKGSGSISCNAERQLVSEINGSGEVRYTGDPRVSSNGNRQPTQMH